MAAGSIILLHMLSDKEPEQITGDTLHMGEYVAWSPSLIQIGLVGWLIMAAYLIWNIFMRRKV